MGGVAGKLRSMEADLKEFFNPEMDCESSLVHGNLIDNLALLIAGLKVRVLSVRSKNTKLAGTKRNERGLLLSFFNPEIESERVTVFSSAVIGGLTTTLTRKTRTLAW